MAKYTLDTESGPAPALPPEYAKQLDPRSKVAVFIAHGMGQQVPFESLDQIAEGLRQRDVKAKHTNQKPVSRAVKSGDQWFHRIELQLKSDAEAVEAHVYEAYWAPLTEGKVTIRDVIRFLAGAGANGLRNARRGRFDRWLFDTYAEFPIPVRSLFYLLITLATIGALVVMNASIVAVAAGLSFLGQRPEWLTAGLLGDLTTTYNAVATAMASTGVALAIGIGLRKIKAPPRARNAWSFVSAVVFTVTLFVVILGGAVIALLFYGHVRAGAPEGVRFWHDVADAARVTAFDSGFARVALIIALLILGVALLRWMVGLLLGVVRDLRDRVSWVKTSLVVALFAILIWFSVAVVGQFLNAFSALPPSAVAVVSGGLGWVFLVAASAHVRRVLVQYIGDVAVYVMPYRLDAFVDLRREIKDRACTIAQGLYAMRDAQGNLLYDKVVVVGHSLGSVIAYDVLNQLIREDEASGKKLNVVARTPLFVTFGSPLDKTAFIFAQQGHNTSEARESLAATVQPMLQRYELRPGKWINIYSGADIISGDLAFYDLEKNKDHRQAVQNVRDPDATTLLVAHNEYWQNDLVLDTLYNAI